MKVNRNRTTESGSFDIPSGGKLHLRLLGSKDLKEMRKLCFEEKVEYPRVPDYDADGNQLSTGHYERFETSKMDRDKWQEELWDRTITGWDGITEDDGTPTPVTLADKIFFMENDLEFQTAYNEGMKALKERDAAKTEELPKN